MREHRFVAAHRGGPLNVENHRLIMDWAIACAKHGLLLLQNQKIDSRLIHTLEVAQLWRDDKVKTGSAMKAAYAAHAVARSTTDPVMKSLARAIGQGVSTAHMADHSVGAALYVLKAINYCGKSISEEIEWQNQQMKMLPLDIQQLLMEFRDKKQQGFKDLRTTNNAS